MKNPGEIYRDDPFFPPDQDLSAVAFQRTVDLARTEFIEEERLLPGGIRAADEDARELLRGFVQVHGCGSSPAAVSSDPGAAFPNVSISGCARRIFSSSRLSIFRSRSGNDSGASGPMSVL